MSMFLSTTYFFLLLILFLASYYDIRNNEIPKWMNVTVLVVFLIYSAFTSIQNAWFSLYSLYAFILSYMLWRVGIIGGGDAKLLALSCLLLAAPSSPDPLLPPLFISLSYTLHFIVPNPELLKVSIRWLIPLVAFMALLAKEFSAPFAIILLFSMKIIELSIAGYTESIPLRALQSHHLVREAIKGNEVVELSDLDMFLRRKDYTYIPPLRLSDEDVVRIKKLWREIGREEVKVAKEKPAIPAILVASVLYQTIF